MYTNEFDNATGGLQSSRDRATGDAKAKKGSSVVASLAG